MEESSKPEISCSYLIDDKPRKVGHQLGNVCDRRCNRGYLSIASTDLRFRVARIVQHRVLKGSDAVFTKSIVIVTVIVIEHQPDLIASADYVIELGPEGGELGGELIYQGTVAELKQHPLSATGPFLRN